MIRRILVPLDNSPFSQAAVEYGCYVAQRQNAEVSGLAIVDIPGIQHSIGPMGIGGIYWAEKVEKHLTEDAQGRLKSALRNFADRCDALKIPHDEVLDFGDPAEIIFKHSIFFDLVVMGLETHFNFESSEKPGDTLDKLLKQSSTPVLGVPRTFHSFKNVVIGFDGSYPSARALQRFIHLSLAKDLEIKIVIASKSEDESKYLKDNLTVYLKSYGLSNFSFDLVESSFRSALEDKYLDWADVVVLGSHSKRGIMGFFVGSATELAIQKARKPVFIGI